MCICGLMSPEYIYLQNNSHICICMCIYIYIYIRMFMLLCCACVLRALRGVTYLMRCVS